MTGAASEYVETAAASGVSAVPLAHLSIELGHLYMEDYAGGPHRLTELFRRVAPWARTAERDCADALDGQRARVSTCFLIDDYFTQFSSPKEVIPQLVAAAEVAGLRIDYVARESACARAGRIDLGRLVESRIVPDPPPGTNGARPPLSVTGWLCNGQRSPHAGGEAMRRSGAWRAPSENGANRHSIFVDVELWDEADGARRWSCPYLSAVWQLLRLGLLRSNGEPVVEPTPVGALPDAWAELAPITKLTERAADFAAYRTFSVLSRRFLAIEQAVTTILAQYAVDRAVADQVSQRADADRIALPSSIVDRIEYAFVGAPWR